MVALMSEPHIEAALEQVKHGAADDYAVVIGAYQRRLRAWLAGVCPPGVEPDEIAHRAFIEAYQQIDRYQAGTRFYSWLSVIARNLLLAELKRRQRQEKNSANYLQHVVISGMLEEVAAQREDEEERISALRSCEESLSEECRALLRERYTEVNPLQLIATHLGKTVAAIKFQLFAIRRNLRDCVRRKLEASQAAFPPLRRSETN